MDTETAEPDGPGRSRRKAGSSAGLDIDAVVDAAAALVDANGLGQLTLGAVANALGIRAPSLYNHVDGLPGLHRELALRAIRELTVRTGRATVGKERDDAVMAFALVYYTFAREHPGLYQTTMLATQTGDPRLLAAAKELLDLVLAVLGGYRLGHEESLHAVRGLRSTLHGFVTLEEAGQFGMPLGIEHSLRCLVRAVIRGVREGDFATEDKATG